MLSTAVKIGLTFFIGAAVGAVAFMMLTMQEEDDRPPIIVSNGSIEVEEVASASGSGPTSGKGTFKKNGNSGRPTWTHEHDKKAPEQFHVLVEGADASCPALYFAQNVTTATIDYRTTDTPRTVIVARDKQTKSLGFNVDEKALVEPSPGDHDLHIDPLIGAELASVTFQWEKKNSTPVTCGFAVGSSPRIIIVQAAK